MDSIDKTHEWFDGHSLDSAPSRAERSKLREAIGVVLSLAFVAAIVGLYSYSRPAHAEEIPVHVYEDGGTLIRLMPGPCVVPVIVRFISQAGPEQAARFRAIESAWRYADGSVKRHAGCWAEFSAEEAGAPEPVLLLLFDDGDRFVVDKAEFLRGKGSGV